MEKKLSSNIAHFAKSALERKGLPRDSFLIVEDVGEYTDIPMDSYEREIDIG
ncbi:MAG: hypothetical protein ACLQNE_33455 [Thermoguttaceae bacterium]